METRREGGFTLIEMTVAMFVFVIALVIILPTYSSISKNASNNQAITTADTAILPALANLSAQVSNVGPPTVSSGTTTYMMCIPSGGVCSSPSSGSTSGSSVVLSTTDQSGNSECTQWEVTSGGGLEERKWTPSSSPRSVTFSAVPGTSDLSISAPSGKSLFSLTGSNYSVLSIDFLIQAGAGSPKREIKTGYASQGTAQGTCSTTPSPNS